MFSRALPTFTKIQLEIPTYSVKKKFPYVVKSASQTWWDTPVIPALIPFQDQFEPQDENLSQLK